MTRVMVFSVGVLLVVLGLLNLASDRSKIVQAQRAVVITTAPSPIVWTSWSYCVNGGACPACVAHGGCTINVGGNKCVPVGAGSAGCAGSRARGSCSFSFLSNCPYRTNLCGTSMIPTCRTNPLWLLDDYGNPYADCGTGACVGAVGPGVCDGC